MKIYTAGSLSAALLLSGAFAEAQAASGGTIYRVGPSQTYTTVASAVTAALANGGAADIQIDAGTYTNDFPSTITGDITLEGVGGFAHLVATVPPPNRKGILDVAGSVTLKYLELSGSEIPDSDGANGAGVRYENGALILQNCYIHDNQDGLLSNADPNGTITVDHSEFARNGNVDISRGADHNIYIGAIAGFKLTNSYSHDAIVGHEVKSRALTTDIENSRLFDNNGTSSYTIDAPNGGVVTIKNNVMEQGPNSQNPSIVAIAEEGNLHSPTSLTMSGNTIVNDLDSSSAKGLYNPAGIAVTVISNNVYGLTANQFYPSAVNTVILTARPALDTSSPVQSNAPAPNPPAPNPPTPNPPTPNPPAPTPNPPAAPAISTTAWYTIVNQNSADCLDDSGYNVANGTAVIQWTCGNQKYNQEWKFQPTDSGFYTLVSRNAPGSVLDIKNAGTGDGTPVQLWQNYTYVNQQWMPVALGNGYYKLIGRNSGLCLDVPYASLTIGTRMWTYTCNGTVAQAFSLSVQP